MARMTGSRSTTARAGWEWDYAWGGRVAAEALESAEYGVRNAELKGQSDPPFDLLARFAHDHA